MLLVEDNPGDPHLVQELLIEASSSRFGATHVEQLGTALRRLGEDTDDVALLDLSLPDLQGLGAFTKAPGSALQLPGILLTDLDNQAQLNGTIKQHGNGGS